MSTYTAIAEGTLAEITDDVERVTGHAPRTLAGTCRRIAVEPTRASDADGVASPTGRRR